jgi:RimJ/RimL family protein N-acetyltransferase
MTSGRNTAAGRVAPGPTAGRVAPGPTAGRFAPGPTIETPRLTLRPPSADDFDAFAAFAEDPEASRFVGGVLPRAVAWRAWRALAGAWALDGVAMFSVIERATGRWIGRVGPWCPGGWPGTEVGWGIVRDAWGQGYAREAAEASMDYAFDVLGWDDVIHVIMPENTRSIALAERLGSTRRGQVQLPPPNEAIVAYAWGQTRAEWRARRNATTR